MVYYDKAAYWQRRANGLCPTCGAVATGGFVNCGKCRAERREYNGGKAERPPLKRPYGSRPNHRSYQWKLNRQHGLCGCGRVVREGTNYHGKAYTSCDECYEYHRQRNQEYMQRQREAKQSGRV